MLLYIYFTVVALRLILLAIQFSTCIANSAREPTSNMQNVYIPYHPVVPVKIFIPLFCEDLYSREKIKRGYSKLKVETIDKTIRRI